MAKRQAQQLQSNTPVIEYVPKTDVEIPSDLPIVVRGQKLTEEQIIKVVKFACDIYATNTYPLHDCLRFAGVMSEATFHFWKRDFKAVKDLFEKAKADKAHSYRNQIRELSWDSLKKQITGYTVDLEEISDTIEFVEDGIDKDRGKKRTPTGAQTITSRKVTTRKIYVKPSPMMTVFALTNLDPENFKRLPTEENANPDGVNIPIIEWVD